MVRNAPPIRAVLQELADFVGHDPVVGHNVRFDLGFLQKQNILHLNQAVDTYELAAIALPGNSRYNLGVVLLHDKMDIKGAIAAWEDYLKVDPAGPRSDNIRNQLEKMRGMAK